MADQTDAIVLLYKCNSAPLLHAIRVLRDRLPQTEQQQQQQEQDPSRSWWCCPRCVLRFGDAREAWQVFLLDETDIIQALATLSQPPTPESVFVDRETRICSACLGLLQQRNLELSMQQARSAMAQCDYEFTDYQLVISLPLALQIRHRSFMYYLRSMATEPGASVSKQRDVVNIKEVLKWTCGQKIRHRFNIDSLFKVSLTFTHDDSANEIQPFLPQPAATSSFKSRFKHQKKRPKLTTDDGSATVGVAELAKILSAMSDAKVQELHLFPPPDCGTTCELKLDFSRDPLYVAGRYNKYSRRVSQTPWLIDGQRKTAISVEEAIGNVVQKYFRADGYTFSASGREDCDVRMLGRGRPFVLEMSNARVLSLSDDIFAKLQREINDSTSLVQVRDLQQVSKDTLSIFKLGEEAKRKNYRCIVWASRAITDDDLAKLNAINDLTIDQTTPIRVLHRRTLSVRKRVIHSAACERINEHFFVMDLSTQAGTYIKEFVHGDLGRTVPNVGCLLGCDADILQLDVREIDLDFPPQLARE